MAVVCAIAGWTVAHWFSVWFAFFFQMCKWLPLNISLCGDAEHGGGRSQNARFPPAQPPPAPVPEAPLLDLQRDALTACISKS